VVLAAVANFCEQISRAASLLCWCHMSPINSP
jgi:hypothetical protein